MGGVERYADRRSRPTRRAVKDVRCALASGMPQMERSDRITDLVFKIYTDTTRLDEKREYALVTSPQTFQRFSGRNISGKSGRRSTN